MANPAPTSLAPCDLPQNLPISPFPLTSATYYAYGDSITAGYMLSDRRDAYPYLIGSDLALHTTDNAVNGAQSCDLAGSQIFPSVQYPTSAQQLLYSVMIGTNDASRDVPGYEAVFSSCLEAAVAYLALPAEQKVLSTDAKVRNSGLGEIDTHNSWSGWMTSVEGASITFPVTLSEPGPAYIWVRIADGDPGIYKFAIDGVDAGTGSTATSPSILTSQGHTNSLALIRTASLSPGAHSITQTKTNGEGSMEVVGVGLPLSTPQANFPLVLVSDIPYALNTGMTGCSGGATASLRYIADIQKIVTELYTDGLNVRYVSTRQYMFGTSAELADQVHPNALGHKEISHAFEAEILH